MYVCVCVCVCLCLELCFHIFDADVTSYLLLSLFVFDGQRLRKKSRYSPRVEKESKMGERERPGRGVTRRGEKKREEKPRKRRDREEERERIIQRDKRQSHRKSHTER